VKQTITYIYNSDLTAVISNVEFLENGAVKLRKNGSECVLPESIFNELYQRLV